MHGDRRACLPQEAFPGGSCGLRAPAWGAPGSPSAPSKSPRARTPGRPPSAWRLVPAAPRTPPPWGQLEPAGSKGLGPALSLLLVPSLRQRVWHAFQMRATNLARPPSSSGSTTAFPVWALAWKWFRSPRQSVFPHLRFPKMCSLGTENRFQFTGQDQFMGSDELECWVRKDSEASPYLSGESARISSDV